MLSFFTNSNYDFPLFNTKQRLLCIKKSKLSRNCECVHALYILHKCKNDGQADSYIERGYLREEIVKTCYVPPDDWYKILDGYEEGEEAILKAKSLLPEYQSLVYIFWEEEEAGALAKRQRSQGEREKKVFEEKEKGNGTRRLAKNSRIFKVDTTMEMNGWI